MTDKPRRTAQQIAQDELAETDAQLAKVRARKERLESDLRRTKARELELVRMRNYRAEHPLLRVVEEG